MKPELVLLNKSIRTTHANNVRYDSKLYGLYFETLIKSLSSSHVVWSPSVLTLNLLWSFRNKQSESRAGDDS